MTGHGFTAAELAALRGALTESSNTARDLAVTAQTRCTRRRALAVVGARTEEAAALLGPLPPSEQSPFAFEVGQRFERTLRRNGAERLRDAIAAPLGLDAATLDVIDVDEELPWVVGRGKREANAAIGEARCVRTDELIRQSATDQLERPGLVLHPRMTLTVTDTTRHAEPDGMVLRPAAPPLLVEIKAYVDHAHRTDTHDLASTRLQLAVYYLAFEQAVARLGFVETLLAGEDRLVALVVLRRANTFFGSASLEDITRDISRIRRGLGRAPDTLAEVLRDLPEGSTFDDPEVLRCLPTRYEPGYCLSSCAMSLQCRSESSDAGRPEYLGSPTREVLAPVGDIGRAHAIATGATSPQNDEERAFAARARPLRARLDAARARCS